MRVTTSICLLLLGSSCIPEAPVDEPPPPTADDDDAVADDDDAVADDDDATSEPPLPPALLINEVVAAGPTDAPGAPADDWVELFNPGDQPVSLEGYSMRDAGLDEPVPLDPSLQVPAGGHLVLLADDAPELGPTHLPFKLSVDGDHLHLWRGEDEVDEVDFGELLRGVSLARNGDGSHDWEVCLQPTPGAANPPGADPPPPDPDAEPCRPRDDGGADDVLEGEPIEVVLSCDSGAVADFDFVITAPRGAGALDLGSGVYSRPTDLADAGRHEVLFAVKPAGTGGVPETERSVVHVVDAWGEAGNEPVDPAQYEQEWGLPVLHLDPAGPLTQEDIATDAWFEGTAYTAEMKIRGASSAGYPKNSFTVEFEPTQLDLRDHGLGRKDHLVLLSNFDDDNAYVRQKLVYDVWADMAALRGEPRLLPRTAWVVVYLDGQYHGLYTAIDRIDDEFMGEMDFDDEANLYKSVNHDANFYLTLNNGNPKTNLAAGWEKKEGPEGNLADLEGLTAWSAGATDAEFAAEHGDWIELDEFIDWFLFVHHFAAADSAGKNAYLYNEPADTRFHYVPWDFNHSLGQNWRTYRVAADYDSHYTSRNGIFAHLLAEPTLSADLWAHYDLLREPGQPLSASHLIARIEEYDEQIWPSAQRDWARWGDEYNTYGGWAAARVGDLLDHEGERAYLEQWVIDREAEMLLAHPVGGP